MYYNPLDAWLAQSVERTTLNRVVAGSSPASGVLLRTRTFCCRIAG